MTIHDRFAAAFCTRVGEILPAADIITVMLSGADLRSGSILPSNHSEKGRCWCVGTEFQIFNRVAPASYGVRDFARAHTGGPGGDDGGAAEAPSVRFVRARLPQGDDSIRTECISCRDKFAATLEGVEDWERSHRANCSHAAYVRR